LSLRRHAVTPCVSVVVAWAREYPWALKVDVQKYFPSIDHEVVMVLLRRKSAYARYCDDMVVFGRSPGELAAVRAAIDAALRRLRLRELARRPPRAADDSRHQPHRHRRQRPLQQLNPARSPDHRSQPRHNRRRQAADFRISLRCGSHGSQSRRTVESSDMGSSAPR
jgi:hypothetical protein